MIKGFVFLQQPPPHPLMIYVGMDYGLLKSGKSWTNQPRRLSAFSGLVCARYKQGFLIPKTGDFLMNGALIVFINNKTLNVCYKVIINFVNFNALK